MRGRVGAGGAAFRMGRASRSACAFRTGRGARMGRTVGVAAALLALGACSHIGSQRQGVPGPADLPPVVRQPAVPELEGRPPGPTRVLPREPLEWDEIDPILHSVVARDPRLQERVEYWVHFWTTRGAGHFGRYLERMAVYEGVVDRELTDRGLPPSLRFLPVVESGYHHAIVSRAGATGLWQLMTPTARGLGLSVTPLVDDRRDPLTSTRAALDYLQELHGIFDSWFLALAAYNAGPGRVRGVLSRHGPAEELPGDEVYLRIRPHLPAETREFVPRFFAAAILASNPGAFGFDVPPGILPLAFDEVMVPDATSLDVVAMAAGVEEDEIRSLNPHYLRGFTPPGEARTLRVPPGLGGVFQANYALIPPEERVSFMEHVVARGETLSQIARRYSVPLGELTSANGNLNPRRLQIGQRLVVPVPGARRSAPSRVAAAPPAPEVSSPPGGTSPGSPPVSAPETGPGISGSAEGGGAAGGELSDGSDPEPVTAEADPSGTGSPAPRRHRVAGGDTLWGLARSYGVSVEELRRWNGLSSSAVLRPGQELAVGAGTARHRVARGDTWVGLARRYGVAVSELARANGRTARDVIRVGEVLMIP
jgi:membrane-bound lytic murein transglycosylase D